MFQASFQAPRAQNRAFVPVPSSVLVSRGFRAISGQEELSMPLTPSREPELPTSSHWSCLPEEKEGSSLPLQDRALEFPVARPEALLPRAWEH